MCPIIVAGLQRSVHLPMGDSLRINSFNFCCALSGSNGHGKSKSKVNAAVAK